MVRPPTPTRRGVVRIALAAMDSTTLYIVLIAAVLVIGISYIAIREISCIHHPPDRDDR